MEFFNCRSDTVLATTKQAYTCKASRVGCQQPLVNRTVSGAVLPGHMPRHLDDLCNVNVAFFYHCRCAVSATATSQTPLTPTSFAAYWAMVAANRRVG